jgi:hypothetical protein
LRWLRAKVQLRFSYSCVSPGQLRVVGSFKGMAVFL